jgi:hypothetical protein
VLWANRRVAWPIEAKVLRTDGAVAGYIADVKDPFLTCRYAPFSEGGAMVAYLMSGTPTILFGNIEQKLGVTLDFFPLTRSRPHRISTHSRTPPAGRPYPKHFLCHHIVMNMVPGTNSSSGSTSA